MLQKNYTWFSMTYKEIRLLLRLPNVPFLPGNRIGRTGIDIF
jgi:hypothetical protein